MKKGAKSAAYKYLQEHPGIAVHYTDVAVETSFSEVSVNQGLSTLAKEPATGVARVSAGQYRFSQSQVKAAEAESGDGCLQAGQLIEVIGWAGEQVIGRCDDGNLVVITSLEVE